MNPEYLENAQYITNLTGLIFKRGDDERNVFECPDCGLLIHLRPFDYFNIKCKCKSDEHNHKLMMICYSRREEKRKKERE